MLTTNLAELLINSLHFFFFILYCIIFMENPLFKWKKRFLFNLKHVLVCRYTISDQNSKLIYKAWIIGANLNVEINKRGNKYRIKFINGVQRILCCVFVLFVFVFVYVASFSGLSMLIVPSVFSNIYWYINAYGEANTQGFVLHDTYIFLYFYHFTRELHQMYSCFYIVSYMKIGSDVSLRLYCILHVHENWFRCISTLILYLTWKLV